MKALFVKYSVSDDCTFSYEVIAPVYAASEEELYTYLSDNIRELGEKLKTAQEHHRVASVAYHALAKKNDTEACMAALTNLSTLSENVRRIQETSLLTDHEGSPVEFQSLAMLTPTGYDLDPSVQILTFEEMFAHAVRVQVAPKNATIACDSDFNPTL